MLGNYTNIHLSKTYMLLVSLWANKVQANCSHCEALVRFKYKRAPNLVHCWQVILETLKVFSVKNDDCLTDIARGVQLIASVRIDVAVKLPNVFFFNLVLKINSLTLINKMLIFIVKMHILNKMPSPTQKCLTIWFTRGLFYTNFPK